jgi:hypothetical protein
MSVISEPVTRVRASGPVAPARDDAERRRWVALVFIAPAQLMVVLDGRVTVHLRTSELPADP